ncbi:kinase-like domain-containing protein [Cladochytrium replicatum]|nr:kinase-like domain-containing protein [Cladochytrium replicatum]
MGRFWPESRVNGLESVWYAQDSATGESVVIKHFEMDNYEDSEVNSKVFEEASILKELSSQYPERIIGFVDFYAEDDHWVLAMERGVFSLLDVLVNAGTIPENAVQILIHGAVEAISFVHAERKVYRDMKPANLLFVDRDDWGSVKLCDFGTCVSELGYRSQAEVVGTLHYMAPEVLGKKFYGREVDMWSIGIVAYQCLFGDVPFALKDVNIAQSVFERLHEKDLLNVIKKTKLTFPKEVSAEAKDFITSMLRLNPDDRLTAEQALQHPWFTPVRARRGDPESNVTRSISNSHGNEEHPPPYESGRFDDGSRRPSGVDLGGSSSRRPSTAALDAPAPSHSSSRRPSAASLGPEAQSSSSPGSRRPSAASSDAPPPPPPRRPSASPPLPPKPTRTTFKPAIEAPTLLRPPSLYVDETPRQEKVAEVRKKVELALNDVKGKIEAKRPEIDAMVDKFKQKGGRWWAKVETAVQGASQPPATPPRPPPKLPDRP